MNIKDLSKPLSIKDIDFRIQSINKGGYATILAYKDARVDINRLNEVCGELGWKREHTRDNHNCIVSIWDTKEQHWVSKEDTGTESNTEQQKGLASDSFKRACFNWGIGIELYDYPVIQVKLRADEVDLKATPRPKATWNLKLKEWIWYSVFNDEGVLTYLAAKDENGALRFESGARPKKQQVSPEPIDVNKVNDAAEKYRALLNNDDMHDEDKVVEFHKINDELTNDERIAVGDRFGTEKWQGGKKHTYSIIKEFLKEKLTEAA